MSNKSKKSKYTGLLNEPIPWLGPEVTIPWHAVFGRKEGTELVNTEEFTKKCEWAKQLADFEKLQNARLQKPT